VTVHQIQQQMLAILPNECARCASQKRVCDLSTQSSPSPNPARPAQTRINPPEPTQPQLTAPHRTCPHQTACGVLDAVTIWVWPEFVFPKLVGCFCAADHTGAADAHAQPQYDHPASGNQSDSDRTSAGALQGFTTENAGTGVRTLGCPRFAADSALMRLMPHHSGLSVLPVRGMH
jgi:hypothetical protein